MVIDGYDEFSDGLSPENQLKLSGLAATIVASQLTPFPVKVVNIIGHADQARTIPAADRANKEMEVSVARARTAESQLRTAMNAIFGGGTAVAAVQFLTSGVGARELLAPNGSPDEQMLRNRRVDITTISSQADIVHVLPEWPPIVPNLPESVLPKVYSIKLMEGVSGAHLFQYTFVVWDKSASRAGVFDYRGVDVSAGASSPLQGDSDWADILVPSTMTVEQFAAENNGASHAMGSLVASFMILNLPRKSVVLNLGLGFPSVSSGSGVFSLAAGSIKPFNGD